MVPQMQDQSNCILSVSKNYKRPVSLSSGSFFGNSKKGAWSYEQTGQYLRFIERYRKTLLTEQCRRGKKIFALMAKAVDSRSSAQCRSHHQKMLKKYENLDELIKNMRKSLCLFGKPQNSQSTQVTHVFLQKSSSVFDEKTQKQSEKQYTQQSQTEKQDQPYFKLKDEKLAKKLSINCFLNIDFFQAVEQQNQLKKSLFEALL